MAAMTASAAAQERRIHARSIGCHIRSGPGIPAASSALEPWCTATTRAPNARACAATPSTFQKGSCSSTMSGRIDVSVPFNAPAPSGTR